MSNVADIKPWFRDDLARVLAGIYVAAQDGQTDTNVRKGIILTVSSICLVLGINPESFVKPDDLQLLKK